MSRAIAERHPGRLALNPREAASALGVSHSHFKRHIASQIPCVYSGSLRLYPVVELQRWLDRESCVGGRAA